MFVAACADSPEKNAGREYVNAARKVAKAEKAFAAADYKAALELCETARSEVERVVDKYPESAIALKVMTDESTLVGPCKYSELSGRIIPLLKTFENPALADAELAWAIAMSNADAARRDDALAELAEAVAASPKIPADKASKIRAAIVSNIKSPELRGRLNAAKQPAQQAAKPKADAPAASPQTRKIADAAAFLKAASTNASLVAYDVRTIDNLREKAKSAAFADNAVKREFVKILTSAQNNIEKISAKNRREKAFGGIAAAFANFGDDARAIETAKKISDPETFAAAFAEIADVVGRGKNSAAAAALQGTPCKLGGKGRVLRKALARNRGAGQLCGGAGKRRENIRHFKPKPRLRGVRKNRVRRGQTKRRRKARGGNRRFQSRLPLGFRRRERGWNLRRGNTARRKARKNFVHARRLERRLRRGVERPSPADRVRASGAEKTRAMPRSAGR